MSLKIEPMIVFDQTKSQYLTFDDKTNMRNLADKVIQLAQQNKKVLVYTNTKEDYQKLNQKICRLVKGNEDKNIYIKRYNVTEEIKADDMDEVLFDQNVLNDNIYSPLQ